MVLEFSLGKVKIIYMAQGKTEQRALLEVGKIGIKAQKQKHPVLFGECEGLNTAEQQGVRMITGKREAREMGSSLMEGLYANKFNFMK